MAQSLDLFLNLGSLIPAAHADLNADNVSPTGFRPGAITILTGAFGTGMYRYGRTQQSGGQSKGELASRLADVTGTVTAETGEVNDTTHLADTSAFTAGNEVGKLCHITNNNDAAGTAPEGEVAVITANTITQLTFDSQYPLSVAPAVSDTFRDYAIYHHDDSADGDLAINVMGIVMADRTAAYYGWLQFYGYNPGAIFTTSDAVTAGAPVVAGAAAFAAHGSDTEQLWVGWSPGTIASDIASPYRSLVFVDLLHASQPVT